MVNDPSSSSGEQAQQVADAKREPAPPNSLPDWSECSLRVHNSDFIAKRVAEGGYGPEPESKLANELHRFIYEYDDEDPYRSAWFLHRLEKLIEFVQGASRPAAAAPADSVAVPTNEDQAALMVLLGTQWLQRHAPQRLKAAAPAVGATDEQIERAWLKHCDRHGHVLSLTGARTFGRAVLALAGAAPACAGSPGECAFNGACMYACGGSMPTVRVVDALRAFAAIPPLAYGAHGTRDVDVAAWAEAYAAANLALCALAGAAQGADT